MTDLISKLLTFLCTGLGEGNTNTDKLTKQILLTDPDRNYNQTKIEIGPQESCFTQYPVFAINIHWNVRTVIKKVIGA